MTSPFLVAVFIFCYQFKVFKLSIFNLQVAMKEKMLTKLERDRAVGQVSFVYLVIRFS